MKKILSFALVVALILSLVQVTAVLASEESSHSLHFAAWKSGDQETTCEYEGATEDVPPNSYIGCMAIDVKMNYDKAGIKNNTINSIEVTVTPYGYHYNGEAWDDSDVTSITVDKVSIGLEGGEGGAVDWSDETEWVVDGETGPVTKKFDIDMTLPGRKCVVWIHFKLDGVPLLSQGRTDWVCTYALPTKNIEVTNLEDPSKGAVDCPYCEFNKHSVCPY